MNFTWRDYDCKQDNRPGHGCFSCRYLVKQIESWELPHIAWYSCLKRPHNSTLKQFPFSRTQCTLHQKVVSKPPVQSAFDVRFE